jgi:glycosyltransferase involved in cell wall biosynthesis
MGCRVNSSASSGPAPLNILMAACVPNRREGGVAAMIYNLGRELELRGHSVTYLFQDDLLDPNSVPSRFIDLMFAFRLSKYIRKNRARFSVVNLHAPTGFVYGLRKRYFPSPKDPPYVMTLHGLEERRVHVMSREVRKGRAWNFAWKNRFWHGFYIFPRFRWSIRTADGAHTIARDTWNLLQLKYNLDADRTAYIPNGVEPRFFVPRSYDRPGPIKLLYAGTWLDQRGIFYLREALTHLAAQLPGLTMTFAGCGCPPETITEFFGAALASTVVVNPVVPAGQMQQLYADHDILLFPSLMEGQPTVVLEAMASGMPVITTETCGMPDVILDGVNGLLIPPANSLAIEQAVLSLASSPELRQRLGQAAQQSMSHYTWQEAARKLEALYRSVIPTR